MKISHLKLFIISALILVGANFMNAYNTPGGSPPSSNTSSPFDDGSIANVKNAGLSLGGLLSGTTGLISVDTNGNLGVNASTPVSTVRVYVNGGVINSSLAGTGPGTLCTSTSGSSTDGYTLTRC